MNKTLIKTRFQNAQPTYAEAATVQDQMGRLLVDKILNHWHPAYRHGLEAGVGTGCLTQLIKARLPLDDLDGIDMIERPPVALLPLIESEWLNYIPQDIETIPGSASSYDVILSNATVQWLVSPIETLIKMIGWLKPGGLLAFTTFGPGHFSLLKQITGRGLDYLPAPLMIKSLKPYASCLWFEEKYQSLFFPSFVALLKHIKATGTNALGQAFKTKSELYQMAVRYQNHFPKQTSYPLTYHPYWFIFQKPSC